MVKSLPRPSGRRRCSRAFRARHLYCVPLTSAVPVEARLKDDPEAASSPDAQKRALSLTRRTSIST
ncbi:MAG: hypothetical protein M5U09_22800 [Gammaproteobacteria bacterium]|nr:hypothetical protein [Gammaproteobacteria bacterium]